MLSILYSLHKTELHQYEKDTLMSLMFYQEHPGLHLALVLGYLTQISLKMQFLMTTPIKYIGMILYIHVIPDPPKSPWG